MINPITIKELDERISRQEWEDQTIILEEWKSDILARQEKVNEIIDKLMNDDRKVSTEYGSLVWWFSFVRIREELKKSLGELA